MTDPVARFHDAARGRVVVNGVDLRDLRLASYRDLPSVVQQMESAHDGAAALQLG